MSKLKKSKKSRAANKAIFAFAGLTGLLNGCISAKNHTISIENNITSEHISGNYADLSSAENKAILVFSSYNFRRGQAVIPSEQEIGNMSQNLIAVYDNLILQGFSSENIKVYFACGDWAKTQSLIPRRISVSGAPSFENLETALSDLSIDSNDNLFVGIWGHGGRSVDFSGNLQSRVILSDGRKTDADIVDALRNINLKLGVLCVDACYSEGFANRAGDLPNFIGLTAASFTNYGYQSSSISFARFFIESLNDPAADTSGDGAVSTFEAFIRADRLLRTALRVYEDTLDVSPHSNGRYWPRPGISSNQNRTTFNQSFALYNNQDRRNKNSSNRGRR